MSFRGGKGWISLRCLFSSSFVQEYNVHICNHFAGQPVVRDKQPPECQIDHHHQINSSSWNTTQAVAAETRPVERRVERWGQNGPQAASWSEIRTQETEQEFRGEQLQTSTFCPSYLVLKPALVSFMPVVVPTCQLRSAQPHRFLSLPNMVQNNHSEFIFALSRIFRKPTRSCRSSARRSMRSTATCTRATARSGTWSRSSSRRSSSANNSWWRTSTWKENKINWKLLRLTTTNCRSVAWTRKGSGLCVAPWLVLCEMSFKSSNDTDLRRFCVFKSIFLTCVFSKK